MKNKESELDVNKGLRNSFVAGIESDRSDVNEYKVIIDGINTEVETKESFSLKLSLFAKVPVTKIKHITRILPAVASKFSDEINAKKFVSLIEEAGGYAHIEADKKRETPKNPKVVEKYCRKCGFPLSEGEKYCSFCMTPVDEGKKEHVKTAREVLKEKRKDGAIPKKRLYFYVTIVVLIIIMKLLMS